MDKIFLNKKRFKKMMVCVSATVLLATAPVLSTFAAGTTTQPIPNPTPETTNGTADNTETLPPQDTSTETTAPSTPADSTNGIPPQTPSDPTTITPVPEPTPADQGSFEVIPMQATVYASSQKGLNVRSGPSTAHSKLGTLKYGQALTVTGVTADNWYQIQYSGGVGYVLADYVTSTPPAGADKPADTTPETNTPAVEPESPDAETPDTSGAEALPDESFDDKAENEPLTEDNSSEEGYTEEISHLFGAPVFIGMAVAILGVIALIGYSVYSLFLKDSADLGDYSDDEYSDDEYYDTDPYSDEMYYEREPLADDEYFEDERAADDEYFEDEPFSDDEYSQEEPRSNDGYYEYEQLSDDEYFENGQYSDEEYYEDGQFSDDEYFEEEQYPDAAYSENESFPDDRHYKKKHTTNKQRR